MDAVLTVRTPAGWTSRVDYRISLEPTRRRVRGVLDGVTGVDSLSALLLLEQGHVPVYYFPWGDVRRDLLEATEHRTRCPHKGEAWYWAVRSGARRHENDAWSYPEPMAHLPSLRDYAAFYWRAMDHWLEEDEEVFVHPRDPRSRVEVVRSERRVEVLLAGTVVADSCRAQFLFETDLPTRFYLPPEDVRAGVLIASDTRTRCPYKGEASYWSAAWNGRRAEDLAWTYADPLPECGRIGGLVAFFNEQVDEIRVDGEPV